MRLVWLPEAEQSGEQTVLSKLGKSISKAGYHDDMFLPALSGVIKRLVMA